MKNFVKPGKCITWTNATGADIPSGQGVVVGDTCVFVTTGIIKDTEVGELLTEGVVRLSKTTSQAYAVGDVLYWDASTKKVTETASTNKIIGFCAEAAVNADTSAEVKLWPMFITP